MPDDPMTFQAAAWRRLEHEGVPLWVRPADGGWFVPNEAGDRLLAEGARAGDVEARRFFARLPPGPGVAVAPRAEVLALAGPTELWLHLTDRCDLACRHCLFASAPRRRRSLPAARALELAREAAGLGCRVFALTGGEPTLHPGFVAVVDGLLAIEGAHVAVLTHGLGLERLGEALSRWPRGRVHFQVSVDGGRAAHDRLRGAGAFDRALAALDVLERAGWPFTIATAVTAEVAEDLPAVVDLAAARGAANVHLLWLLPRGRSEGAAGPEAGRLAAGVREAARRAEAVGVALDNVDDLRGAVFSAPGTARDGTSAGWESVAVGPDGRLYPTPATVGLAAYATALEGGLERAWRESPTLAAVRRLTARGDGAALSALTGGGDLDRRILGGGGLTAPDPLLGVVEALAAWLVVREAEASSPPGGERPALRLERGDVVESCDTHGAVALGRTNCLLAVAGRDGRRAVSTFYARAAETPDASIRNPVSYPPELVEHVPQGSRVRSYGCGSPVLDAAPAAGEVVVDLGCGAGVECFVAARLVGPTGRVIGVDMLEPMLARARAAAGPVAERLGFANVGFEQGYLERLPLPDGVADAVISNCVINLSVHKRRTFAEVLRVLAPGGRLVVSDVACETEPAAAIRNDERLRGECIGGAPTQRQLFGLLAEVGFEGVRVVRRFPYRVVGGHPFFSLTYEARKPAPAAGPSVRVLVRGPAPVVFARSGRPLFAGEVASVPVAEAEALGEAVFVLDDEGRVTNVDLGGSACCCSGGDGAASGGGGGDGAAAGCCCCGDDDDDRSVGEGGSGAAAGCCCGGGDDDRSVGEGGNGGGAAWRKGCAVCGAAIVYLARPRVAACARCGGRQETQTECAVGHFVCDACHGGGALAVIERLCRESRETDMIALFATIRAHPSIKMHGPEHHALVPAIIVATSRNLGGPGDDGAIATAVARGARVPGGFCGFAGGCGAGLGVGIGLAVLLEATPLTAVARRSVLRATSQALAALAEHPAARCCQRDGATALRVAAKLSAELLPVTLRAAAPLVCEQFRDNRECLGRACACYPIRRRRVAQGEARP